MAARTRGAVRPCTGPPPPPTHPHFPPPSSDFLGVNFYSRALLGPLFFPTPDHEAWRGRPDGVGAAGAGTSAAAVADRSIDGLPRDGLSPPPEFAESQEGKPRLTQMPYGPWPRGLGVALRSMSRCGLPLHVTECGCPDGADGGGPEGRAAWIDGYCDEALRVAGGAVRVGVGHGRGAGGDGDRVGVGDGVGAADVNLLTGAAGFRRRRGRDTGAATPQGLRDEPATEDPTPPSPFPPPTDPSLPVPPRCVDLRCASGWREGERGGPEGQ